MDIAEIVFRGYEDEERVQMTNALMTLLEQTDKTIQSRTAVEETKWPTVMKEK